jgi:hypothetical protein
MKRVLMFMMASICLCRAQDVLEMKNGTRRSGEIVAADEKTIRLAIEITPQGKAGMESRPTIGVPRSDVGSIALRPMPGARL